MVLPGKQGKYLVASSCFRTSAGGTS